MLFCILFALCYLPCIIFFPIKKIGKKHYKELRKKKQNYIIACNHMSNWDPIILDIVFAKKHRILAKKELFSNKFTSKFMESVGAIKVDRNNVDATSIKKVLSAINKKKNILIFPQGTRAKTVKVDEGSAKEGVAMFSIRTGTPVIPMMFNKKIKGFHKTKLFIGEPLYPDMERKKDKEYLTEFSNLIIEKMNSLIDNQPVKNYKKVKKDKAVVNG